MSSRLARFAAVTALAFVVSRVLGLVRDQVIAARFGAGTELSAYHLAFQIPDTLFILISGGALSTAFIPVFSELLGKGEEDEAWRMASGTLAFLCGTMLCLLVLAWIFAPQLVGSGLAGRATPRVQARATELMRILLLSPLLLTAGSIFTSILQTRDRFTLPAFAPVAYNLGIIGGAVLLAPRMGMDGVAVGVVVGACLFGLLQLGPVIRLGLRRPNGWPLRDPHVVRTLRLLVPRIVGQSATQLSTLFTFYLAGGLEDEGAVGAYRLAFTLFVLPVGLFATSVGTVAFPALSREAQDHDAREFTYLLRRAMRGILFFVLPAGVGLAVLRLPITSLIYERGAFTPQDTRLTAYALLFFCLGMWAYALLDIVPRAFYALQDTRTPLLIALGVVVLDVALSLALVGPLGLGGLAFAFSAATGAQVVLLLGALRRKVGHVLDRESVMFFLKALGATALMLGVLLLTRPLLAEYGSLSQLELLVRVLGTVGGAGAVYLLASVALRQEEVGTLLRLVRR